MKIAELEKAFRDIGADARWNDLRGGRGVPLNDMRGGFRDAVAKLVGEVLNIENARTAPSTAVHLTLVCSENGDPRAYRVRLHVDLEPVED